MSPPNEIIPQRNWIALFRSVAGVVVLYTVLSVSGFHLLHLAKLGDVSTIETIVFLKLSSLCVLLIIGLLEALSSSDVPRYLKVANIAVFTLISLSIIVTVMKLFAIDMAFSIEKPQGWDPAFRFAKKYGDFVAFSPIVAYALLNLGVCIFESSFGDRRRANHAATFFAVADLPCLIPILAILYILYFPIGDFQVEAKEAQLLFGGAMAMFIYTSSILTSVATSFASDNPYR